MNVFSVFGQIGLDDREYNKALTRAEGRLDKFGQKLQSFGRSWSLFVTTPITAAGGAILAVAGNFEQSMNKVAAISKATGRDLEMLERQARELGETTVYSASQAADAMTFLAMAGYDANTIYKAMPDTLQLAASAQLDLATAADIVTNVMSGFGIEADDLGGAVDVLAKAFTSSNTDLQQLGDAFRYAGPVAKGAGMSFEETAAALGLMGNAGIQSTMAGTSLRGALTRLLNPTRQVQDVINRLGLDVHNADGSLRSMTEIVEQLEVSGANTGDMMVLFGQRAGPAMAALVEQGSDALATLTGELEDSAGTAAEIAEKQMEGFKGAMVELRSALEGLAIAIAQSGLLEWAENMADRLTNLVRRVASMDEATLRLGVTIAGIAAATGPIAIFIGSLIRLSAAFLPFLGPVGILATAAALIYTVVNRLGEFEEANTATGRALDKTREEAEKLRDKFVQTAAQTEKVTEAVDDLTEATDENGLQKAVKDLAGTLDDEGAQALLNFAEATAYPLVAQGELQDAIDVTLAKFLELSAQAAQTDLDAARAIRSQQERQRQLIQAGIDELEELMVLAMRYGDVEAYERHGRDWARDHQELRKLNDEIERQDDLITSLGQRHWAYSNALEGLESGTHSASEALEKLHENFELVGQQSPLKTLAESAGEAKETTEGLSDAAGDAGDALGDLGDDAEEAVGIIAALEQDIRDLQEELRKSSSEAEIARLNQLIEQKREELEYYQGLLPEKVIPVPAASTYLGPAISIVPAVSGGPAVTRWQARETRERKRQARMTNQATWGDPAWRAAIYDSPTRSPLLQTPVDVPIPGVSSNLPEARAIPMPGTSASAGAPVALEMPAASGGPNWAALHAKDLETLTEAEKRYLDLIGEGPTAIDQYIETLEGLQERYPRLSGDLQDLIDGLTEYQDEQNAAEEADRKRGQTLDTINDITSVALSLNSALGLGLEDVINGVAGLATAIVSGNPFEIIAASIDLASALLGDFSNGMKEVEAQAKQAAQSSRYLGEQLVNALAQDHTSRVSRGGLLGVLGFTKAELNTEAFQAALAIAEGLANGIASGMQRGVDAWINEDDDWKARLEEGLREAIFDAIYQAFVESAIAAAGVQDFILEFTRIYNKQGAAAAQAYAEEEYPDLVEDITDMTDTFLSGIPNSLRPEPRNQNDGPDGTERRNFTGGSRISEITGPTRDLLLDTLSPLANLDSLTGIGNRIYDLLDARLPRFTGDLQFTAPATGMGAVTFERGAFQITIEGASDPDEMARELAPRVERIFGGLFTNRARGRGQ